MKNIHILPTDKRNRLYSYKFIDLFLHPTIVDANVSNLHCKNQNIYITNDEEIKNGQYGICLNLVREGFKSNQAVFKMDSEQRQAMEGLGGQKKVEVLKVVLTTDQDLIKDGVQAIDDEFLEWFVNNSSCEEIEVHKICYGALSGFADAGYKIIISKEEPKREFVNNTSKWNIEDFEEPKQKTLEEATKIFLNTRQEFYFRKDSLLWNYLIKISQFGAKWQQEQDNKMYSKEDLDAFRKFMIQEQNFSKSCLDLFIKQFKKK